MHRSLKRPVAGGVFACVLSLIFSHCLCAQEDAYSRLADPDDKVRQGAVAEIFSRGASEADRLRAIVEKPRFTLARAEAARLLGRLKSLGARDTLVALIEDRTEPFIVRCAAAESLGQLGDSSVVPSLIEALKSIPRSAATALAALGSDAAIPELFETLRRESYLRAEWHNQHRNMLQRIHLREEARTEEVDYAEVIALMSREADKILWEIERSSFATVEVGASICRLGSKTGVAGVSGVPQAYFGSYPSDGLLRCLSYPNPVRLLAYARFEELFENPIKFTAIPEEHAETYRRYRDHRPAGQAHNWWQVARDRVTVLEGRSEASEALTSRIAEFMSQLTWEGDDAPEGNLILLRDLAIPAVFSALAELDPKDLKSLPLMRILNANSGAAGMYGAKVLAGGGSPKERALGFSMFSINRDRSNFTLARETILNDEDSPLVRCAALDYLIVLRDREVVDSILKPLLETASEQVVAKVCEALGALTNGNDTEALSGLKRTVSQSSSEEVRFAAATALIELGDLSGFDELIRGLGSSEEKSRKLAVSHLREFSGIYLGFDPASEPAVSELHRKAWRNWWSLRKSEDFTLDRDRLLALSYRRFPMTPLRFRISERAVRVIHQLGQKIAGFSAVAPAEVRTAVSRIISSTSVFTSDVMRSLDGSNSSPLDLLARRVDDPDPSIRLGVVVGFGMAATPDLVPLVLECLDDESRTVRMTAADSLTEVGLYGSPPPETRIGVSRRLKVILENEKSPLMQVKLHEARLAFGDGGAVKDLIEFLAGDEKYSAWSRSDAFFTLKKFTGQDFGYEATGTPQLRSKAVKEWQEWWKTANKRGAFKPLNPVPEEERHEPLR